MIIKWVTIDSNSRKFCFCYTADVLKARLAYPECRQYSVSLSK